MVRLEPIGVVDCSSCKTAHRIVLITAKKTSFYYCIKTEDRVPVEAA